MEKQKAELLSILHAIEGTQFSHVQSIDLLLDYGFRLTAWGARSGELMAEAKEMLHRKRAAAYLSIEGSKIAQDRKWAVSMMKDYVNDKCPEENAYYVLAERTNRMCTHTIELIRTAISALKEERKNSGFQDNQRSDDNGYFSQGQEIPFEDKPF